MSEPTRDGGRTREREGGESARDRLRPLKSAEALCIGSHSFSDGSRHGVGGVANAERDQLGIGVGSQELLHVFFDMSVTCPNLRVHAARTESLEHLEST